ncbi:MAG: class I SAM-dependent methyltransferase [Acidimicrobiales bacterium]
MTRPTIASGTMPDADHLPEGDEKVRSVRAMFDTIAPRYDLVNRVMTFGMDVRWRRTTVARLDLPEGACVLDLACGTGDLCRELAQAAHRPVGVDLSFGMLAEARTSAPLVHADILRLPVPDGAVDGVTCGFALRNLVDLRTFFVELDRVYDPEAGSRCWRWPSRPAPGCGGVTASTGRVVPRIGGLLSDAAAYRYLPKSVAYLPPADRMLTLLGDAGFVRPRRDLLAYGLSQLITATRSDLVG